MRSAKKEAVRRRRNNILAMFVFAGAGYISLNILFGVWYYVLGAVFLIAALYGVVTVGKEVRFVF
jgi:uncharacterized integral membrane protein